ncbi:glycosyltransferase, partial [Pseudorhodobacter sp.]|uniref:glycosyltransferase n=1 Tax=Pseudorhodobacter sp. TaxID=1934400 RepID=UPI0039E4C7F3
AYMFRQMASLRARFLFANLKLDGKPFTLQAPDGKVLIRGDTVRWRRNRLHVSGQAGCGTVTLRLGDISTTVRLPAPASPPSPSMAPFSVTLPWPMNLTPQSGLAEITASDGAAHGPKAHGRLGLGPVRRQTALLTMELIWILLRLGPAILKWRVAGDLGQRRRVKHALRIDPPPDGGPIAPGLFTPAPQSDPAFERRAPAGGPIVIIVPVYNAFDVLCECLERVVAHTDLPWTLILVEDVSTDARVRPYLRAFAKARNNAQMRSEGPVILIEQEVNGGFVTSMNTAFACLEARPELAGQPVVLLNSDALVPKGWASRLTEPLSDATVASVTPLSNDAEIFSVPQICARSDLQPGQAEAIDAVAQQLLPATALARAPTGVGFCMAIAPQFLARVPRFDTAFGQGYGEEVDWCQKLRASGGHHLGTARLFVEHRGGGSFGTDQKQKQIARNAALITARYSGYDQDVQAFLHQDPLRGPRLALAVAWAASATPDAPVPIYLAHSLGGGAEGWLAAEIATAARAGRPLVVLRVGGPDRWQIEVHAPTGNVIGQTNDFSLIERLLEPLTQRRIIYSCGVGDPDPFDLPARLISLKRQPQDRVEVLFHDFLPVSPSFHLLDSVGRFHGPVTPETIAPLSAKAAAAYHGTRPGGQAIGLAEWQYAWGCLLQAADEIRVFCPSGAALVAAAWPGLRDRITVQPHRLSAKGPGGDPLHNRRVQGLGIGVLGNIAPHKGAALVQELAQMGDAKRGCRLALIGNIDPAYALPRSCPVHGTYIPADIPVLAAHYGITHWLIPSIWPETFSFATHEALATGLPVLAFDIGAQGEAVRAAPNGIALRYSPGGGLAAAVLGAVRGTVLGAVPRQVETAQEGDPT